MKTLLAVDLGLRTGLALYGETGKLIWYRSHNLGTTTRLKRAVHDLLTSLPELHTLVIEGGGTLAMVWQKEADRRCIACLQIAAQNWREDLLLPRQQRSGLDAKRHAAILARAVIAWSQAPAPTSLRHDAAEAILIGLWGVLHTGWLQELPRDLQW